MCAENREVAFAQAAFAAREVRTAKGEVEEEPVACSQLCWRYLVLTLFKDWERARRLFPALQPGTRYDLVFTNNLVEAYHSWDKNSQAT